MRSGARRFNWLSAGRRWRKTTLAMAVAVEAAADGAQVLWGAPTYDQVRIGWDEARKASASVAAFTLQRMTAEFPAGGRIIYRSLDDPDNARGHTADGVVIDEAGDVKAEAWYEVLRPMLMDTDGWAWIIGTPKGRNWFWREHMGAAERTDSAAWQAPTLGVAIEGGALVRRPHPLENPEIPFSEIEQIWRTTPEYTFQQEILAQFIENAGGVFRRVMEAATERERPREDGHQYVAGVDVAALTDYTVASVMDVAEKRQVYLDRYTRVEYGTLEDRLVAVHERYGLECMLIEANSVGQPVIDHLRARGVRVMPFTTTNATKHAIVTGLQSALEHGEIRLLDHAVQTGELQAFEMERLPSGTVRYSAPEGMHDDTVMALALAWQAASTPTKVRTRPGLYQ